MTVGMVLHLAVLAKCAQFFISGPARRDVDKHLVAAFAVSAVFFFVISVANALYFNRVEDNDLHGLLALWSGFVVFNATIHLSIVTLLTKRAKQCGNGRRVPRGVG